MRTIFYPQKCNNISYPGKTPKLGINLDGKRFFLKLAESHKDILSFFSEYLSTILFRQLSVPTSQVEIVKYGNSLALLSKDFMPDEYTQYFPLASYYEELIDTIGTPEYSYELFVSILQNKCPGKKSQILSIFWKVIIIDYLLCNGRSAGNIAFFDNGLISLAPIFDTSTRLKDINDLSYKDLKFPHLYMSFGGSKSPGFSVLQFYKDKIKDEVLDECKRTININNIETTGSIEEEYLLKVINYRYKKIFER